MITSIGCVPPGGESSSSAYILAVEAQKSPLFTIAAYTWPR
jgi:hypothetical protein